MYLQISNLRIRRYVMLALIACALIGSFSTVREYRNSLDPVLAVKRDFIQEYLLAASASSGIDPYSSLEVLARRVYRRHTITTFPHPCPHPPGLIPFVYPLGYFPYFGAQLGWGALQLFMLFMVCRLYIRRFSWTSGGALLFALAVVASRPGYVEFVQGQLGMLLAVLIVYSLWAIEQRRYYWAGLMLGAALAFKFYAAPVLVYFFVKKRWNLVVAAACSFCSLQLLAIMLIGVSPVVEYYTTILPSIANYYRLDVHNISLLTLADKLTIGSTPGIGYPIVFAPLLKNNALVHHVVYVLTWSLGVFFLFQSIDLREGKASLVLFAAQLLFNPIQWIHGYVIALLLMPWIFSQLPRRSLRIWQVVFIGLCIGDGIGNTRVIHESDIAPFVMFAPAFMLAVFLLYFARIETNVDTE